MNRRYCLAALTTMLAVAVSSSTGEAATQAALRSQPAGDYAGVLVHFRPSVSAEARESLAAALSLTVGEPVRGTDYVLLRTQTPAHREILKTLEQDSRVVDAELNYVRRATAAAPPNDPEYPRQQSYLEQLRLPEAWEGVGVGAAADVRVAVIDTGVDAAQPDLVGRVLPGHDFANDDNDAYDDQWHGTWVAAIIAANTNNGVGIAGVSPSARIIPVKVLDSHGNGTDADIAAGITWAADHEADVINLSLGGPRDNAVIRQAIEYALDRDVVVVAAAGNNAAETPQYPAAYPGVVAVAAVDGNGRLASFSGHGAWIDIAAPGVGITSARSRSSYEVMSGTSYSAPFVSGVASLVQSLHPFATASDVISQLLETAQDAGPIGVDHSYGHGILDAGAAVGRVGQVAAVAPPLVPAASRLLTNPPARAPAPAAPPSPDDLAEVPVSGRPVTVSPSPSPVESEGAKEGRVRREPAVTIRGRRITVSTSWAVRLRVACSQPPSCRGRLTLRRAASVLGRSRFSIKAGRAEAIRVRLRPAARQELASRRIVFVRAVATSTAGAVITSRLVRLESASKP